MSRNKKWTLEIDERRALLLHFGYTNSTIAMTLNKEFGTDFTRDAVSSRNRKVVQEKEDFNIKASSLDEGSLFPKEVYEIDEELTFTPEKKRRLFEIWDQFNDGKAKKILSLSDLHSPFIDFKAVETAVKNHNDADILILNGDVFDGHALSDYDKLNDFDIEIEFKKVFQLLDVVSKIFKTIIWNGGNHDMGRFMKFVARKFGTSMKKYVMKRLNPIDYIAEKYDNVIVVPHDWVEIGKCIFVHPSGYSSALMSTALGQENVLRANGKDILPEPNFHCLVQGHTHDLGEYYINDCKVMEQGCLCETMDYRFDRPTKRKWQKGYAIVHIDEDGNVDFNNSRTYSIQ